MKCLIWSVSPWRCFCCRSSILSPESTSSKNWDVQNQDKRFSFSHHRSLISFQNFVPNISLFLAPHFTVRQTVDVQKNSAKVPSYNWLTVLTSNHLQRTRDSFFLKASIHVSIHLSPLCRISSTLGNRMHKKSHSSYQRDDVHVCIMCLRAIMNYQVESQQMHKYVF